jgi:hypothetical protein
MQNNIQQFFSFLVLCCAFAVFSAFDQPAIGKAGSCQAPATSVVAQGTNYVTFGVETPAPLYEYHYVRKSDNTQSGTMTSSNGTITIGGLSSGAYDFYFRSICEDNGVSEYIVVELIL